ncbi:MAG: 16S rRNA (adenine(1518)-N(6)/adenine(1519)-N(6))-dimethyltransferase RsmA [Chloroflexota bacterium]
MPPPTTVPALRALLDAHGLRPKKSLGQNFLISESLLQSIVRAADMDPDDVVIEVGPGVGTLTYQLALTARRVVAVELDQHMVAILRDTLASCGNVTVLHQDILRLDIADAIAQIPTNQPTNQPPTSNLQLPASTLQYKVVANLPYYITSAVIRKFLDSPHPPNVLVLMVQHEVAQRIMAAPGDMSLLAVSVQFYAQPSLVMKLPAGAFYPAPQVDSAVVRLDVRAERPAVDVERFFRVAHAGFGQKRKQLRNSLAAGLGLSGAESEAWLRRADIDPQRRAQTLTIAEWVRLTQGWSGEN